MKRQQSARFRRRRALLVAGFGLAVLLVVALVRSASTDKRHHSAHSLLTGGVNRSAVTLNYGATITVLQGTNLGAECVLGLDLERLDRGSNELQTTARIGCSDRLLEKLVDPAGRPIADRRHGTWHLTNPRTRVYLDVIVRNNSPPQAERIRFDLRELFRSRPEQDFPPHHLRVTLTRPLNIGAVGNAGAFPDEGYTVGGRVTALLKGHVYLRLGGRGKPLRDYTFLPVTLAARETPRFRHLAARIAVLDEIFPAFGLIVREAGSRRLFTYLLAIAPLILVLVALRVARTRGGLSPEALLPLAVGLLALPPLRQTLVPADINTLTRVDWLLILDVFAIAAVATRSVYRARRPIGSA